jgi:hypothetical protein
MKNMQSKIVDLEMLEGSKRARVKELGCHPPAGRLSLIAYLFQVLSSMEALSINPSKTEFHGQQED